MIYKWATAISAVFVMANAIASFWFYFHGDVLRGIFFLGGANLSMMMTLNFIKLIDNITAVNPMRRKS